MGDCVHNARLVYRWVGATDDDTARLSEVFGSRLTANAGRRGGRPVAVVDLSSDSACDAVRRVASDLSATAEGGLMVSLDTSFLTDHVALSAAVNRLIRDVGGAVYFSVNSVPAFLDGCRGPCLPVGATAAHEGARRQYLGISDISDAETDHLRQVLGPGIPVLESQAAPGHIQALVELPSKTECDAVRRAVRTVPEGATVGLLAVLETVVDMDAMRVEPCAVELIRQLGGELEFWFSLVAKDARDPVD